MRKPGPSLGDMKAFHMRAAMPIRTRVDARLLASIKLVAADAAEKAKLQLLRDRLASCWAGV